MTEVIEKIYLLQGETGEYSDTRRWTVRAYRDKSAATNALNRLNDWLVSVGANNENSTLYYSDNFKTYRWEEELRKTFCPYDPDFDTDYTGTRYAISEVELI